MIAAAGTPAALDALLALAGVDGTRRRLARMAAAGRPDGLFQDVSLAEVLAVGQQDGPAVPRAVLDAWGVASRFVDGSLGLRMPRRLGWLDCGGHPGAALIAAQVADLQVRVAECLAELRLPAALARGVLSQAVWDLTMTVQVAGWDDWLPVIRAGQALSVERFGDFISALAAAGGPLIRVETPGK